RGLFRSLLGISLFFPYVDILKTANQETDKDQYRKYGSHTHYGIQGSLCKFLPYRIVRVERHSRIAALCIIDFDITAHSSSFKSSFDISAISVICQTRRNGIDGNQ